MTVRPKTAASLGAAVAGAFETPSGASDATVYFYKGATFVEITLETDASGPPKDQVIALATTAAGRV